LIFRFTSASDPIGYHGSTALLQPLNLNLAYRQLGRLPLNHTLTYHLYGWLPLTWPMSFQRARGRSQACTLPGEG